VEVQLIPIGIEREAKSSGKERWWKIAGAENVPTSPVWARRPLCPESGQTGRCLAMSALCHKRPWADATSCTDTRSRRRRVRAASAHL